MVTYAQALATPGQEWAIIVTIEGVGEYAGLWRFCTRVPNYAFGDALYKPWMTEFPQLLSERINPLGGLPESGELSVSLLDVGRQLTSALRFLGTAADYWQNDLTSSATSATLGGAGTGVAAGTVAYSGNEAIRVVTKASAVSISNMTRGYLDTDAWVHRARDNVFPANHYLMGRRMRLYLAPVNGNSASDETELGQYAIDDLSFDPTLNGITLRGTTQLQYLARNLPRQPRNFAVRALTESPEAITFQTDGNVSLDMAIFPSEDNVLRLGDELLQVHWAANTAYVRAHSVCGSEPYDGTPYKIGATGSFVLAADPDVMGAFRRSDGSPPATTTAGSWTVCTHPMDILLCLLLSSYHPDDGLHLTNYSGQSNWSSLPIGWGLGLPVAKVDVASFTDVKARFSDLDFRDFVFGDESQPFAEMVTETFLRPLGAYFTTSTGRLRIVVPKLPSEADTGVSIGANDILTKTPTSPGEMVEPGVALALETSLLVSSVAYKIRGAGGQERTFKVENSDFAETFGQRGYYGTEKGTLEIDLKSFRASRVGIPQVIQELAYKRLYRFQRPLLRMSFTTDTRFMATGPGDLISLTLDELPDFRNGTRDWAGVKCEVIDKTVIVDEDGARIEWSVLTYGPSARVAWVAPAARVASVSGAGPYVCTVDVNRYTQADAPTGLPNRDCDAFQVGDRVGLRNFDGSEPDAGTWYAISAIGSNTITISGNFGGALATNTVLVFTDFDNAVSQQTSRFAFEADRATRTAGAAGVAFAYGEP